MKSPFAAGLWFSLFAALVPLLQAEDSWTWSDELVPDLGFDLDSARVIHITSLESEGKGTLREALWKEGPRIIVFDVGGVIDLKLRQLMVSNPQVVVAGQTAPHPGITLIKGGLAIRTSQALVQHIAVRPGDAGLTRQDEWSPDGFSTQRNAKDVWIDNCSFTWSVDENLSASSYEAPDNDPARRIYFRNCIVAEALHDSTHPKGPHSKGSLIHDGTQQVSIVRCLYASNVERNPLFKPQTSGVVVNNFIAGHGQRAVHSSEAPDSTHVSVVGNVVKFSPDSRDYSAIIEGQCDWYAEDNVGTNTKGEPIPLIRKGEITRTERSVWPEGLEALPSSEVAEAVAKNVGSRPARRDPIDARIVKEALEGTTRIIHTQETVGGYPSYEPVTQKVEVPDSGRREWLSQLSAELRND